MSRARANTVARERGEKLLDMLCHALVGLVQRPGPDLTTRQLGVLMTCALDDRGNTVRGLAAALNISKPAITRAVDRLSDLELLRRAPDPSDRRSVLVYAMPAGRAFMSYIRRLLSEHFLKSEPSG